MKLFETDVWRRIKDVIFLPPLREVLSENGIGSYSRYTGFMVVLSTLGWITYLVVKNHALPDLEGPAVFMTVGAGTQYGIGQVKHMIAASKAQPKSEDGQ